MQRSAAARGAQPHQPWKSPMRAVIYARFSSAEQNERSTADQIALCRGYAARERLTVVGAYEDKAISGASIMGRAGLIRVLALAQEKPRPFDVLLVEALDRLSRDMADLAGIHKQMEFLGVEIRGVHDGRADTVLVGLRGLVGQLYREDGAKKVRRGLAAVVRDGRHAGGRAYGYRAIPGRPGELEICPNEAEVVRRVFADFVAGIPPREIAGSLNREGVAPPRGRLWNASTINGNAQRGNGLILSELYAGRIVWNKLRMVKDPATGRRVSRPNPPEEWMRADAPHLRIVDEETWARANGVKRDRSRLKSHEKRKPRHLFSGLLRCGVCGSGLSVHDHDHAGRTRLRCSAVRESGSCTNTGRFHAARIEGAVLDGMRDRLRDPRLIEVYIRKRNEEMRRLRADAVKNEARLESTLANLRSRLERVTRGYVAGILTDEEARAQLPAIREQIAATEAELAVIQAEPTVIALHPTAVQRYLEVVENLSAQLTEHLTAEEDRGPLADTFRELIQTVTIYPTGPGAFDVEVKGRLAQLIGGRAFPEDVGRRVVAGEGLEPPTQGL